MGVGKGTKKLSTFLDCEKVSSLSTLLGAPTLKHAYCRNIVQHAYWAVKRTRTIAKELLFERLHGNM